MTPPSRDEANRTTLGYMRFAHLGTQFCLLVAGGALGGWWLDGKVGIAPIFTVLGTFLGFGYGIVVLYRAVYPARRGDRKEDGDDS